MPSLSDSLSALADYSAQIHKLSASNLSPSGPYTTAYLDSLHLNPAPHPSSSVPRKRSRVSTRGDTAGVLHLIRDAQESEVRLFRFIGEAEVAGIGRVKRVEKRDEGNTRAVGVGSAGVEGRDEVEVMLRTALRLVDDYRPMPRARATIASLLETHHNQLERVAELELKIEEASTTPTPPPSKAPSQSIPSGSKPKTPKLSFEETIKAEELALRRMESDLIPLRSARSTSSPSPSSALDPAFTSGSTLLTSPPASSSRTPAKTPSNRNITNSLVNGTTPRRPLGGTTPGGPGGVLTEGFEFDRFSPLKFLGTPRAGGRAKTKSTLREVMGSPTTEGTVGRGIFGRRNTGAGAGTGWDGAMSVGKNEENRPDVGEQRGDVEDEDQTVRFIPAPEPKEGYVGTEPQQELEPPSQMETEPLPVESAEQPIQERDGTLEGIQLRLPIVEQAITKIKEGLPEMLRQGLSPGSDQPETTEETIKHLARISRSDPSDPPSPSSHSTSTLSSNPSTMGGPPVPPITPQTILTAHLLLALLRGDEGAVSMSDLKDDLGAVARARGWEASGAEAVTTAAAGGMVTKCIYHVVGKRVVKIDRKAGARVMFAI